MQYLWPKAVTNIAIHAYGGYPPPISSNNTNFLHRRLAENREKEPVLRPPSGPQHNHELPGARACCCPSPSSTGLLWLEDKVFPKHLAHHEAKVCPVP